MRLTQKRFGRVVDFRENGAHDQWFVVKEVVFCVARWLPVDHELS